MHWATVPTTTTGAVLDMEATRRKKAYLAIDAIIRGLEFDQVNFAYDELASPQAPDPHHALRMPVRIERIREVQTES